MAKIHVSCQSWSFCLLFLHILSLFNLCSTYSVKIFQTRITSVTEDCYTCLNSDKIFGILSNGQLKCSAHLEDFRPNFVCVQPYDGWQSRCDELFPTTTTTATTTTISTTTTMATTTTIAPATASGMGAGAITGIVIGVLVILVLLALCCYGLVKMYSTGGMIVNRAGYRDIEGAVNNDNPEARLIGAVDNPGYEVIELQAVDQGEGQNQNQGESPVVVDNVPRASARLGTKSAVNYKV